ncbi:MAG TPA: DUF4332 domain-containing protein, partial [Candidatus Thermoplasmatota archaeon]|nr:DUF4332 domain-containing protein [Candidatus Thermoplasmatota archaeon]
PAPSMEDSEILEIEGIGPAVLHRLESFNIFTLDDLAHADPLDVSRACEVPLAVAKGWQGQADLLRLGTLGADEASLLVQGGVNGAADLARRDPHDLARTLREQGASVTEDAAERWIREARAREERGFRP